MSLIGKEINDFSVWAYQDKDFKKVTKEDIKGKWRVFFFYPADFTFVCPTELEDLQNRYDDFKKESCEIFTVSTDTHFVHKACPCGMNLLLGHSVTLLVISDHLQSSRLVFGIHPHQTISFLALETLLSRFGITTIDTDA